MIIGRNQKMREDFRVDPNRISNWIDGMSKMRRCGGASAKNFAPCVYYQGDTDKGHCKKKVLEVPAYNVACDKYEEKNPITLISQRYKEREK